MFTARAFHSQFQISYLPLLEVVNLKSSSGGCYEVGAPNNAIKLTLEIKLVKDPLGE